MLPQKKFETLDARNAIFGHFCDITVKKFRSLHSIFTGLQYRWKHIHLLFMILLGISRYL